MCEDCAACVERYTEKRIPFEFLGFIKDLEYFKEFMQLRDKNSMFDEVKAKGGIGMLCVQLENGEWTLEWEGLEVVERRVHHRGVIFKY